MNIFKKIIGVLSKNKKKQEIKQCNDECPPNTTENNKGVWHDEPCVKKYDKNNEVARRLLYIIKNI